MRVQPHQLSPLERFGNDIFELGGLAMCPIPALNERINKQTPYTKQWAYLQLGHANFKVLILKILRRLVNETRLE